jgi:hypothetical protein
MLRAPSRGGEGLFPVPPMTPPDSGPVVEPPADLTTPPKKAKSALPLVLGALAIGAAGSGAYWLSHMNRRNR